ncbi:MAG: hypothetical protein ACC652_06305 [Acidimicrobiales bacterium]
MALGAVAVSAVAAVVLSGPLSSRLYGHGPRHSVAEPTPVSEVAGFTKIGFIADYLVVVNVLPGEEMFSPEEVARDQPTLGEMAIGGEGSGVVEDSRHVEAHVYDRATGLAVTDVVPVLEVVDRGAQKKTVLNSVLMQDVNIGSTDLHFGDNLVIGGGTDLRIRVTLGPNQEILVDGYLD